jgi:signal peptidase I
MNQEPQGGAEQDLPSTGPSSQTTPGPQLEPVTQEQAVEQSIAEQPPQPQTPRVRADHQEERHGLFGVQAFFTVVIFSIFVITFIVQAFQIPSGSMENTLLVGDFLLVDKLHFAGEAVPGKLLPYGQIKRGDIIVFYYPVDPKQFLVKRVIGLPGDHIRMRNRTVYVNGAPLHENYVIHKQWMPDNYRDNFPSQQSYSREIDRRWRYQLQNYIMQGEVVVPQGQYFVMGDNRDQSLDSRYWGFVPRANIVGRPLMIYLSVTGSGGGDSDDKLLHSGQLAHWLHFARWGRMFRLVR